MIGPLVTHFAVDSDICSNDIWLIKRQVVDLFRKKQLSKRIATERKYLIQSTAFRSRISCAPSISAALWSEFCKALCGLPRIKSIYMLTTKTDLIRAFVMYTSLQSGPSCSKLTMSLVNIIIKYGIHANIFAEKNVGSFCKCQSYSHIFSAKIPVIWYCTY